MSDLYYQEARADMLPFIPQECKTILEVGCGAGNFGRQLKARQGAEVWGVEPDSEAASDACKVLDKVINDFFSRKVELPKNYFDCIVFNDVLEHTPDPWECLEYCRELLKQSPSACLVASIPNFRYIKNIYEILIQRDFGYVKAGILDKTHLRFFTLKSIYRLFDETRYDIISIKGIHPSIHPAFRLLNAVTLNSLNDMKYFQYAVIVRPKNNLEKVE